MKTDLQIVIPRTLIVIILAFFTCLNINTAAGENNEDEDVFEIFCPPTKWLNCGEELWDLDWLGNAWYKDYTGTHDAGHAEVKYYLNDCNIGYITRTWKIADYHGYWHKCSQKIYVQGNYFNSSSIKWPSNVELTGCNPGIKPEQLPYGKNMPTWSTNGATCSKIGYSYHDNKYVYGPGCYEIIRTWTIVDCCNFNPWTNQGIWTYNQRIKVTTAYNEPQAWVPEDITVTTTSCEKAWVDVPLFKIEDGCDDQYQITNNSPYSYYGGADASGKYPVGTTKIRYMVKYNCWETKFFYVNVTVKDHSTPTPYCYYGLAVSLMGVDTDGDGVVDDGMREIWASELDAGSNFACNPYASLKISFSSDPYDNVRVFTCEDVGKVELDIWVTASSGQQDYCTTYIKLQNNAANIPNCEALEEAYITGNISSVFGNTESLILDVNSSYEGMTFDTTYSSEVATFVIDSTVNNDGSVSYHYGIDEVEVPTYDTTQVDKDFEVAVTEGEYMLENLDLNEDYELTLYNAAPNTQFIDSMDVYLLAGYLDGQIQLNMYQKLAADLNHDKIIDLQDLAILNDFVNGNTNEEMFNWVTLDPDYSISNNIATDIDEYPTSKMVEIKNRNAVGVDLMIFQMGDLTDKTNLEDLFGTQKVALRSNSTFELASLAPNPFKNETHFNFNNDKSQNITIEIYSLNGAKVYTNTRNYNKGVHAIKIDRSIIDATGVYFYQLKTETESFQGKLIRIN
ncbi:T9SS type A sorting domain-containing protein [Portibacter lacus]|uniref:Secretion system C-terminal sorting domain-containing protein n=1 Tax=Portibacter lacus TaxID=1099794 RepID=A0AA37SNC2_9BACT|nr:T9SS type A sorting domain-containing protein [Portibacter lacus]GLR16639.1 hypothetical protein GCM10007940_12540 [Portibacter lacus]